MKRLRPLAPRTTAFQTETQLGSCHILRPRKTSFVIDGEAVVLGPYGISDFDALYGGKRNADVRLYAFDLLADDGVDMRDESLRIRKLMAWQAAEALRRKHHSQRPLPVMLARSAQSYSAKRACRGWKASCRSIEIASTRLVPEGLD
jgi:ATP-dependent DNA ligase